MGGRLPRQTANTIAARNCALSKDQSTNTTIIAKGDIDSSDEANTLPKEGHADLVALGKSGLANHNWPERVRTGAAPRCSLRLHRTGAPHRQGLGARLGYPAHTWPHHILAPPACTSRRSGVCTHSVPPEQIGAARVHPRRKVAPVSRHGGSRGASDGAQPGKSRCLPSTTCCSRLGWPAHWKCSPSARSSAWTSKSCST